MDVPNKPKARSRLAKTSRRNRHQQRRRRLKQTQKLIAIANYTTQTLDTSSLDILSAVATITSHEGVPKGSRRGQETTMRSVQIQTTANTNRIHDNLIELN
jgi:hypothetical protein